MKTERIPAPNGAFQVPGLNAVDGEKKVILMAHGFGSEKRGTTPLFMTKGLKAAGFGVYGFDFPAHGDSPLDGAGLTVENCMESCAAAEARVRELAPGAEIGYFGSSYGAYCFLLYLATRPHHGEKAFLRSAAVDMPGLIWRVAEENGGLSADGYVDLRPCRHSPLLPRGQRVVSSWLSFLAHRDRGLCGEGYRLSLWLPVPTFVGLFFFKAKS